MSELHSSGPPGNRKPAKPCPAFPLYAHAARYWAKKIRGKVHYFGLWAYPDAALDKYLAEKDALHAGRKPREEEPDFYQRLERKARDHLERLLRRLGECHAPARLSRSGRTSAVANSSTACSATPVGPPPLHER